MYQLFFYREGRRKSPEMNTVAKDLSDADLDAISEWVSKLPPPAPAEGAVDEARYLRGAASRKPASAPAATIQTFPAASRWRVSPASARAIS